MMPYDTGLVSLSANSLGGMVGQSLSQSLSPAVMVTVVANNSQPNRHSCLRQSLL